MTIASEIDTALAEYHDALREECGGQLRADEARERLEELVSSERRSWSDAVRRIARTRRPGWDRVSPRTIVLVDHSQRPLTASIHVDVEASYCDGKRRGLVRLSGDWAERDQVLEELRRLIGT